jgi:hypothetical protein
LRKFGLCFRYVFPGGFAFSGVPEGSLVGYGAVGAWTRCGGAGA